MTFKQIDQVGNVTTYWDLVTRLWDREFVGSHTTTSEYLNNMPMYPSNVVQDMTERMTIDNKMAVGRAEIGDRMADLNAIRSNLLAFAGPQITWFPRKSLNASSTSSARRTRSFASHPAGTWGSSSAARHTMRCGRSLLPGLATGPAEHVSSEYRTSEMERIWQFLGLTSCATESRTKRQNMQPLATAIANFDEIRDRLLGTQWEAFLDDA